MNNNWLDNSFSGKEKKLKTSNSVSNLSKTKERFYNLEGNVKGNKASHLTMKENKRIDLSGYITRMENNRLRHS